MMREAPGSKLNHYVSDYVVFDLETTGLSCACDQVIELSAVKVRDGEVVDEFSTLVNPGCHIPDQASYINGIDDDMVQGSPCFEAVLERFLAFAGEDVLVGHNIHSFDMKFLRRDAERFWGKTVTNNYVDTLSMARQYLPQLRHHRLVDLAEYYGISSQGAHRALNDCRMNWRVFECLAREAEKAADQEEKVCPRCGSALKKRSGRYGEFWGCSGFPGCRFTMDI